MDAPRFANALQTFAPDPSRRVFLPVLATGLLTLCQWAGTSDAAAKRKRKKRKKRKKRQPEESCEETCHPSCARCFHRPDGVSLCSSQGGAFCNLPCRDDNHCVGTGHPYCTTGQTHFASGTTQLWDCPSGDTSYCTDVEPCG